MARRQAPAGADSPDPNIVELGPLLLENPSFDITDLSFNVDLEFGFSLVVEADAVTLSESFADGVDFSVSDVQGVLSLVIGFDFVVITFIWVFCCFLVFDF